MLATTASPHSCGPVTRQQENLKAMLLTIFGLGRQDQQRARSFNCMCSKLLPGTVHYSVDISGDMSLASLPNPMAMHLPLNLHSGSDQHEPLPPLSSLSFYACSDGGGGEKQLHGVPGFPVTGQELAGTRYNKLSFSVTLYCHLKSNLNCKRLEH